MLRRVQVVFGTPQRAPPQPIAQLAIEFSDALVQIVQVLTDLWTHRFECSAQAIALGGPHLHQLATSRQQRCELARGRIRQWPQLRLHDRRELCQHLRIQRVGLGQPSRRPREIAHLTRVDRHHR
jgi:ABC-type phosphate transport system substrate-binding protein